MKTDTSVTIRGRRLRLSLQVLRPDEREPLAAAVAWLVAMAPADPGPLNQELWTRLAELVVTPYVSFTIEHEHPERLGTAWWGEAIRQATLAFISANQLEEPIRRSFPVMTASAGSSLRQ
jgi:hypothetical protein